VLISHFDDDLCGRSYASEEQMKRPKRNCVDLLWSKRLSIPDVMTFFRKFNAVDYVFHAIFALYILASDFLQNFTRKKPPEYCFGEMKLRLYRHDSFDTRK
jgi:hypothetical protein